jgi:type VI secretion system secreted protein VgrG
MAPPIVLTTPLGASALFLKDLSAKDRLSGLFSFELDLVAENTTAVPFEQLLGGRFNITLAVPGGTQRFFDGICSRISQGKKGTTFTEYSAEVVPQLWSLTRKRNSRIFQNLSVPDILRRVLTGMTPVPSYQLLGTYEARDYCVQYRESDFDFASRLMQEEGIYYFFTHSSTGHTMVVSDTPKGHPLVRGGPNPVLFANTPPTKTDSSTVFEWVKAQELRSGKYTLWDHNFELPASNLEAKATIQDAVQVGAVTHHLLVGGNDKFELYDFPGGYAERFDGVDSGGGDQPGELQKIFPDAARTVQIRMQQEALPSLLVTGSSNCRHFAGGHKFSLRDHFNGNGQYVLTGISHSARVSGDPRTPTEATLEYHNGFTCIPIALPFRPPRSTSRPVIAGVQSATVVGPAGQTEFRDKYGRVKVQFRWDRQGKNDAHSSGWVRVAALHAGQEGGFLAVPRIGQEVIVGFLEGDPDRPIILGSTWNPAHMPPSPAAGGSDP